MDKNEFVKYVSEHIDVQQGLGSDFDWIEYAECVYDYFRHTNEHGRLNCVDAHAVGEAYIKATEIIKRHYK